MSGSSGQPFPGNRAVSQAGSGVVVDKSQLASHCCSVAAEEKLQAWQREKSFQTEEKRIDANSELALLVDILQDSMAVKMMR